MAYEIDGKTAETKVVLNTAHARALLRKRYAAPEWALMEEVAPSTGGGTRYADAVAVNLWRSRGHAVHGFEIKISRGDWLKELKDPSKAEPVYRYCDAWWIVAPKGVVKDGELPPNWGLLEMREASLLQAVAAPVLKPEPIDKSFFASLMRRGHESIENLAENKIFEIRAASQAQIQKEVKEGVERATRHHAKVLNQVEKFESETGLSLSGWDGPPIETIKLALQLQKMGNWSGQGALRELDSLAASLEKAAAIVREAKTATGLQ